MNKILQAIMLVLVAFAVMVEGNLFWVCLTGLAVLVPFMADALGVKR